MNSSAGFRRHKMIKRMKEHSENNIKKPINISVMTGSLRGIRNAYWWFRDRERFEQFN
jgi:DUF2075 family protein